MTATVRMRTGSRAREDGYILPTVLGVMVVSTIVITVLLTVTASNARVVAVGINDEQQVRAAEGALNIALNQIRNVPTLGQWPDDPSLPGDLANKDNYQRCLPVTQTVVVDTVPVRVSCWSEGTSGTPEVPTDDGQLALRLNGGTYDSYPDPPNRPTSFAQPAPDHTPDRPGFWAARVGSWQNAVGAARYDGGELNEAQLVHLGEAPLRVAGGIEVKREVAALRTTFATSGTSPLTPGTGPALDVYGTAVQGGGPLYAAASTRTVTADPPSDPRCGVSEVGDAWTVTAADVVAVSELAPNSTGFVCGDSSAASMGNGGLPPGSGDPDNQAVQIRKRVPFVSADCQAFGNGRTPAGVMYLEGAFDAEHTKILNRWFNGECPETTFYFEGDVWFDVYDPSKPATDPMRHSLVFNDRTSNWVFGFPKAGWEPANGRLRAVDFPEACDRRSPPPLGDGSPNTWGSNITLSSRTGLYHQAGRVAVCGPKQTGDAFHKTAISQSLAPDVLGATLAPTGIADDSRWSPTGSVARIQRQDGVVIRATAPISPWWQLVDWVWPAFWQTRPSCFWSGSCIDGPPGSPTDIYRPSFRATGFGLNLPDTGPQPITTAWVDLTGDAEWSNHRHASTRFDVTLSDGRTCAQQYGGWNQNAPDRMPDNFSTVSYNLMDASKAVAGQNSCASQITNRSQLRGAAIRVTFQMNAFPYSQQAIVWICQLFGCNAGPTSISTSVDAISLRTEWSPVMSGPTSAEQPCSNCVPWSAPANAATQDGVEAVAQIPANATANTRLRYGNVSDDSLRHGHIPVQTLTVSTRMRQENARIDTACAPQPTCFPNSWVTFKLRMPGGTTCTLSRRLDQVATGFVVNLPFDVAGGACTRVVGNGTQPVTTLPVGDLVSFGTSPRKFSELDVEFQVSASSSAAARVWVDFVRLGATTQPGFERPLHPFVVRWNPMTPNADGTGRPQDALFTVFGSTSVPHNAVEVTFDARGRATGFGVFNGGSLTNASECSRTSSLVSCRPGLQAGALATWTTEQTAATSAAATWPSPVPDDRLPDPVATSGAKRRPDRNVVLTACVVDDRGTPDEADDRYFPRALADAKVSDVTGNVLSPGTSVTVRRWKIVNNDVANLQTFSTGCFRPAGE
jgi:hypothetical protein